MNTEIGFYSQTFYYYQEGKENLDNTVELVYKRLESPNNINKVVVFTSNGEGALKLKELLKEKRVQIIAATFPHKKPFYKEDGQIVYAETSEKEIQRELKKKGIKLIQSVMALQDIPFPTPAPSLDNKIQAINFTLSLFCGGLRLCIDSILMATDAGYIEQGEEVIAFSADTAIIATGCYKGWLFHPTSGLEIKEIICKPRNLSITHKMPQK